jgi:hypothetical protein
MPDPAASVRRRVTGDMLIAALPDGRPPRGSKLKPQKWRDAATIFAERREHITLRELGTLCGVSHKTAWRMRDIFRDAAQVIREQSYRGA